MASGEDIAQAFGAAVRTRRLALHLSQEDLADQAGLHRTYISDIERGRRNVTLRSAARIAEALAQTLPALLDTVK